MVDVETFPQSTEARACAASVEGGKEKCPN